MSSSSKEWNCTGCLVQNVSYMMLVHNVWYRSLVQDVKYMMSLTVCLVQDVVQDVLYMMFCI